jgi:hypothetical protein
VLRVLASRRDDDISEHRSSALALLTRDGECDEESEEGGERNDDKCDECEESEKSVQSVHRK